MQWKSFESVTFTSGIIKSQNCDQVHRSEVREVVSEQHYLFSAALKSQPVASQESPNEILKLLLIAAVSGVFLRLERKRERRGNERERDEGMRESEREE